MKQFISAFTLSVIFGSGATRWCVSLLVVLAHSFIRAAEAAKYYSTIRHSDAECIAEIQSEFYLADVCTREGAKSYKINCGGAKLKSSD